MTTDITRLRRTRGQVVRFVVVGAGNTIITGVLLAVSSRVMDPQVAYTLVFSLGVMAASFLHGRFVFRTAVTLRRTRAFVVIYLAVYAVGSAVLYIGQRLGVHTDGVAIIVVAVTAPLNFLGSRYVFDGDSPGARK